MATFDVRLPLKSGRKMPERLMSGFDCRLNRSMQHKR